MNFNIPTHQPLFLAIYLLGVGGGDYITILTCAFPLFGQFLVDVEDSGNLQFDGVQIRSYQGPQLKGARTPRFHYLKTKKT
jgi:hypothetical protein